MTHRARLSSVDWAWLHAKAALLVWAALMWAFVPDQVEGALRAPLVGVWVGVTLVGVLTSSTGLVLAALGRKVSASLTLELAGICLAASGPIVYLFAQWSLAPSNDARWPLLALSYFAFACLAARAVTVWRRRKRIPEVR